MWSHTSEIFSLFLFLRSVAFTSLICAVPCLSLPKVNLLSWSGKWSAQQDKNLEIFPNSGAEFYYSNTWKELRRLAPLYVPMKLHDSSPNFILQFWKLTKYVSFSVIFFFFPVRCEDHSLLWEQLIFFILIVSDGETNILVNFTKTVVRKDSYSVEQENSSCEYSCSNCCTYLNCPSDTVQILTFKSMQLIKW